MLVVEASPMTLLASSCTCFLLHQICILHHFVVRLWALKKHCINDCIKLIHTIPPRSLHSVGPVPGRSVSGHGRARLRYRGRGLVWRQEWRTYPDLAQGRLHPSQEPRPQGGQEKHSGQQAQAQQEFREQHRCSCHQNGQRSPECRTFLTLFISLCF